MVPRKVAIATLSVLEFAALSPTAAALLGWGGQTDITNRLNVMIARGSEGVYTGGKGVIVRNPYDGFSDDKNKVVVPASFWVNDIFAISQLYPNGDPRNPTAGNIDDPWEKAVLGLVVGADMNQLFKDYENIQKYNWGNGVFYAADSNSCDQRCRWLPDKNGYDCPGGFIPWGGKFQIKSDCRGAGSYPEGNPNVDSTHGGGSGCHWGGNYGYNASDQVSGDDGKVSLLRNHHCECNYAFKNQQDPYGYNATQNGWNGWVDHFHQVALGGKAAHSAMGDIAACWVNNPRDMINLQNWLWWDRTLWNDQLQPIADYWNSKDVVHARRFWGWNEVPVSRTVVQNANNWDAVMIQLPAGICSDGVDTPFCLSQDAQAHVDQDLAAWRSSGYLKPGLHNVAKRPGSYMAFVRQKIDASGNYFKEFFCTSWTSQGGKFAIVYLPISGLNPTGACYVDTKANDTEVGQATHVDGKLVAAVVV